jgi:hypothetical protein
MWYWHFATAPTYNNYGYPMFHKGEDITNIPCWSLSALLNILPEILGCKPIIALDDNYITYPHISDLHTKADDLVDACVELIEKLHELNLL